MVTGRIDGIKQQRQGIASPCRKFFCPWGRSLVAPSAWGVIILEEKKKSEPVSTKEHSIRMILAPQVGLEPTTLRLTVKESLISM